MFMKCFKKKLATGLLVANVVCGLSSGAFAREVNAKESDSHKFRIGYTTKQLIAEIASPDYVMSTMGSTFYTYRYSACAVAYEIQNEKVINVFKNNHCLN